MTTLGYASAVYHGLRVGLKFPGMMIQWKLQHRKAKNEFKKTLVNSGLPPGEAQELAELYPFKLEDLISLARG